jgi:hypothetical protein
MITPQYVPVFGANSRFHFPAGRSRFRLDRKADLSGPERLVAYLRTGHEPRSVRSGQGRAARGRPLVALTREWFMGIFSWFRSRWITEDAEDDEPSLVFRNEEDDPELYEIRRAAAEDVAAVERDDKFFGRDAPANQDEGL